MKKVWVLMLGIFRNFWAESEISNDLNRGKPWVLQNTVHRFHDFSIFSCE